MRTTGEALGLLAFAGMVAAEARQESSEGIEFFEKKIRPVLTERCYACHSARAEKLKAGLRLDTREGLLTGGDRGPSIVPGDPEKSILIRAIRRTEDDLKMPPKGKLSNAEIADFESWVRKGVAWPAEASSKPPPVGRHWAFEPPKDVPPPSVKQGEWVRNPIDAFILARLEESGLAPSPPADRRTLLRRATYDLHGLPPTPAEIDSFLADEAPDAFAKVVDRLLASPRYGERWARYWLDVARYADTTDYDVNGAVAGDVRLVQSSLYRDWVIRALNEDLPYDQFLIQQMAADQAGPDGDPRALAGMGFLTIGRRFTGNAHDIIDDRLDVIGRGALGLTLSCARCHDHKFDPIPTRDYYSLYGVFQASKEKTVALEGPAPGYDSELQRRNEALASFKKANGEEGAAGYEVSYLKSKIARWEKAAPSAPPRAVLLEEAPAKEDPRVFKRGNPGSPGESVPRQFLEALCGAPREPFKHGSGRLELARAIASPENPLTARVMANRIWLHHFGEGLVRTPSDFGLRSEPPSHPELLDWLACRFMAEAWSIKKLHRLILGSAAYQQSSRDNPAARRIDPENRLLWRANPRRLDFEAMRDSLLAVAGALDTTQGGAAEVLTSQPYTRRRSVYGFVDRLEVSNLLLAFDVANPSSHSPRRHATTVPQQALFMMNSPFLLEQARRLAARSEIQTETVPEARIQAIYRIVFGRRATSAEADRGRRFVEGSAPAQAPERPAWTYGYGEFDASAGRVARFRPLPCFTGQAWQCSPYLPDPELGWIMLDATGGAPGDDPRHGAIRRWVASRDGTISIRGNVKLLYDADVYQGSVRARIVSSRSGEVRCSPVGRGQVAMQAALSVQAGETIDFIVDCPERAAYSRFGWAPAIEMKGGGVPRAWSAEAEFGGPPEAPLTPWEAYAHVLLMSNEFLFLD